MSGLSVDGRAGLSKPEGVGWVRGVGVEGAFWNEVRYDEWVGVGGIWHKDGNHRLRRVSASGGWNSRSTSSRERGGHQGTSPVLLLLKAISLIIVMKRKPSYWEKFSVDTFKRYTYKPYGCLVPGCTHTAINSHLLQRKVYLESIAEDQHLMQFDGLPNLVSLRRDFTGIPISKIGINRSFSLPLFCNKHDTELFSLIERSDVDWFDRRSHALLSYRALCAEYRKKEQMHLIFSALYRRGRLIPYVEEKAVELFKGHAEQYKMGMNDLGFYKHELELELSGKSTSFEWAARVLPSKGILAACSVFTPMPDGYKDMEKFTTELPWPYAFVMVIPKSTETVIVVGKHNDLISKETEHFFQEWVNQPDDKINSLITELIACHSETWCMSPTYYKKIPKDILSAFLSHWNKHNSDHEYSLRFGHDILSF